MVVGSRAMPDGVGVIASWIGAGPHAPLMHGAPMQSWPHMPQLSGSFVGSMQIGDAGLMQVLEQRTEASPQEVPPPSRSCPPLSTPPASPVAAVLVPEEQASKAEARPRSTPGANDERRFMADRPATGVPGERKLAPLWIRGHVTAPDMTRRLWAAQVGTRTGR